MEETKVSLCMRYALLCYCLLPVRHQAVGAPLAFPLGTTNAYVTEGLSQVGSIRCAHKRRPLHLLNKLCGAERSRPEAQVGL